MTNVLFQNGKNSSSVRQPCGQLCDVFRVYPRAYYAARSSNPMRYFKLMRKIKQRFVRNVRQ
jgi:hypothetical protein